MSMRDGEYERELMGRLFGDGRPVEEPETTDCPQCGAAMVTQDDGASWTCSECSDMPEENERMTERAAAERAASRLMVNAFGERGERLVLTTKEGRDLGGWCEKAIADVIEEALRSPTQKSEK